MKSRTHNRRLTKSRRTRTQSTRTRSRSRNQTKRIRKTQKKGGFFRGLSRLFQL